MSRASSKIRTRALERGGANTAYAVRASARPATPGCAHARSGTDGGATCSACWLAAGRIPAPARRSIVSIPDDDDHRLVDEVIDGADAVLVTP